MVNSIIHYLGRRVSTGFQFVGSDECNIVYFPPEKPLSQVSKSLGGTGGEALQRPCSAGPRRGWLAIEKLFRPVGGCSPRRYQLGFGAHQLGDRAGQKRVVRATKYQNARAESLQPPEIV
ncbi:MAG: hypothetical protein H8E53_04920, partial [Planctomycetes bacterium]|nr:hypothetical protein [Planctomycetota bacterium]